MTNKSMWIGAPPDINKYFGFVYKITEKDTGKFYIGLKRFWFKDTRYLTKKPTKVETTRLNKYSGTKYTSYKKKLTAKYKGKKRRIRSLVESDWETYNTSSKILMKKIPKNPSNYEKKILQCFETISEMKLYEAYLQLDYLFNGEWSNMYNKFIGLKLYVSDDLKIKIPKP